VANAPKISIFSGAWEQLIRAKNRPILKAAGGIVRVNHERDAVALCPKINPSAAPRILLLSRAPRQHLEWPELIKPGRTTGTTRPRSRIPSRRVEPDLWKQP
jgi:hypothetical protein